MSLESKIATLTTAIEKLTAQMAGTPINAEINEGPFYWRSKHTYKIIGVCVTRDELLDDLTSFCELRPMKCSLETYLDLSERAGWETNAEARNKAHAKAITVEEAREARETSEITTEKTSEVEGEEASVDYKAMAEKINAEAEKKALAKSKREAKKAEAGKKAQEEQNQADATAQSEEEQNQADAQAGNELPETEVTADDLKAACLTAARAEEGNKVKVKALLAKYDATVVKDVAPANRAEILAILESGEF